MFSPGQYNGQRTDHISSGINALDQVPDDLELVLDDVLPAILSIASCNRAASGDGRALARGFGRYNGSRGILPL